jgi:hypothetical protein
MAEENPMEEITHPPVPTPETPVLKAPPGFRERYRKGEPSAEDRAYNTERKRRSRAAIGKRVQAMKEVEDEQRAAQDPEFRTARIMRTVSREDRSTYGPGVPLPDPGPARLPTLAEMVKDFEPFRTEATRQMIERYQAAMQVGAVTLGDYERLREQAYRIFGHCSPEAIIAIGTRGTEQ